VLVVDGYLEAVVPGMIERYVKHEHGAGLDLRDPRRWLGKRDGAVAVDDLGFTVVDQSDADRVLAELRASPFQTHDEVHAGVYDGKVVYPNVLEDPHNGELAILVDECVVTE
jgi:hypothetical protein